MKKRIIKKSLIKQFWKAKIVILTGARQTGKTTLIKEIINEDNRDSVRFFNCDNPSDRNLLDNKDLEFLINLIGDAKIIFIDEGQKVESIGQTLKILVDHYGNKKQIIATGSSSFNLLERTQEALTGRKFVFHLFPLSLEEIHPDKNMLTIIKELPTYLTYGNYPEVVMQDSFDNKKRRLEELVSSCLYSDILEFQKIKSHSVLINLLKALAYQVGSEVSYTELSSLLGIDKNTVERYVNILEKNYIIFRLPPYASNKRKTISKLRKIYFCDIGVRNALIGNFNFPEERNDVGILWENFIATERLKFQAYHEIDASNYFWRTYDGAEVDWVEERAGKIYGHEFKWNSKAKGRVSSFWRDVSDKQVEVISPYCLDGFVFNKKNKKKTK